LLILSASSWKRSSRTASSWFVTFRSYEIQRFCIFEACKFRMLITFPSSSSSSKGTGTITGHCFCGEYYARFVSSESASCPFGDPLQTHAHILMDCLQRSRASMTLKCSRSQVVQVQRPTSSHKTHISNTPSSYRTTKLPSLPSQTPLHTQPIA